MLAGDDQLWKSDGTEAGTVLVSEVRPGVENSFPSKLTAVGNRVFFTASSPGAGFELWTSDGTAVGTHLVEDITSGAGSTRFGELMGVGGRLIFAAGENDLSLSQHLWTSDGTAAGTQRLTVSIHYTDRIQNPRFFTEFNGLVYLRARYLNAEVLLKTDGTPEGTAQVASLSPESLEVVGGKLFFSGANSSTGRELWKLDGPSGNPVLVKDIWHGDLSSNVSNIVDYNGTAYFAATIFESGTELWKSDGTAEGTVRVLDLWPGFASSSPGGLIVVGDKLFFSADNGLSGRMLWSLDLDAAPDRGDYDYDGNTNGSDFLVWQRSLGSPVVPGVRADGDLSGAVDAGDLDLWLTYYGSTPDEFVATAAAAAWVSNDADAQSTLHAAVDSIYAAGDFTKLFVADAERERSRWRPRRR
jgi:ELWxxDGT repeat protein